jgi:hypothetical protein
MKRYSSFGMKNRSPTGTAFPGQNYCESRVSEPVGTFSELPSPLSERIVLRDRYLALGLVYPHYPVLFGGS